MKRAVLALMVACGCGWAQQDVLTALNFDHLKAKAKESVDVSLDSSTLQFAGRFLSGGKGDEAKAKKLMAGLKGLFVRVFEFEKEGEYGDGDLKAVRALAKGPGWSRVVDIAEASKDRTEVYTKTENGAPAGLIVIAAERKELTVVYIDGPIDLKQLGEIGGSFGIPAGKGSK